MKTDLPSEKDASDVKSELRAVRSELAEVRQLLQEELGARKARRIWRPSLRVLFVLTAVAACWSAWLSYELQRSKRVKTAGQELARIGATITSRPSERLLVATLPGRPADPPAPIRDLLGRDLFTQPDTIRIQKQLTDEEKARLVGSLSAIDSFREVRIENTKLSSNDMAPIWRMPNLQSLFLRSTRLSRCPLDRLAQLDLRYFDASHTLFDDSAAASLAECADLVSIKLDRTALTPVGLMQFTKLQNLSELHIRRCPINLKAVQAFSDQMPNCYIEYEPLIFNSSGRVDTARSSQQRLRFGPRQRGYYRSEPSQAWGRF
ncbi:MAG: hypothetical protein Aurels2KO_07160 [Aureliella sp.]